MLRIAVAGGTGTVGRHAVEAVQAAGPEAVILCRSHGDDLLTTAGLDKALDGVDAVIDTANVATLKADAAISFFATASENLVSAAAKAGARHFVLLSIVGIDSNPYDYYAGKVAQERVVEASPVPWTILRATQFHEFAEQMLTSARIGPLRIAPNARIQPIAAAEVAARLASLAAGRAQGRVPDLAGPKEESLADMVRRLARAEGYRGWIPALNVPTKQMAGMRAGSALPGPHADQGVQTFTEWLPAR
jgi:uncharacterized protein YbjT (DUF2867 family)